MANMAHIQELKDVEEELKKCLQKYDRAKIVYDAIYRCAFYTNNLDSNLKVKVQNVLLETNCAQVTNLSSESDASSGNTLLGLQTEESDMTALTFQESQILKKAVTLVLEEQYKSIMSDFHKFTGRDISATNILDFTREISQQDEAFFEMEQKVDEQHRLYICNLLKEQEILENLCKLRLEKLKMVCEQKATDYEYKSKMNMLRAELLQKQTRVKMFTETSNSLPAYKELLKDIHQQQQESQVEVVYLQKLKEKYNQVSCKQYDDILKEYFKYKAAVEQKKLLNKHLEGKENMY